MSFKKIAKKGIVLSLIGITIATPVNTVSAMEQLKTNTEITSNKADMQINILKDDDTEKIVEVTEGDLVYTSTCNKKENTLLLRTVSTSSNKEIGNEFIDLNINHEVENNITPVRMASASIEKMRCIYSKLAYSINMKSWTITNSKGSVKKRPETNSHKEYLYKFRNAVKASRRSENSADAAMDASKLAAVGQLTLLIAGTGGAGAIVAAVVAIGGTASAGNLYWDSIVERREADRYFALL